MEKLLRGLEKERKAKTGFDDKKVRNIIFRVSKEGKIKKAGRGIYISA